MGDGSSHPMLPISPQSWESSDGSGFQIDGFDLSSPSTEKLTLIDRNGTRYYQPVVQGTAGLPSPAHGQAIPAAVPSVIEDTNGNTITFSQAVGWTDSMGRVIPPPISASLSICPQTPLAPTSAYTWNFPGLDGGSYPITFCYVSSVPQIVNVPNKALTGTQTELQSVLLPNGTAWTFHYTSDGNGDLSQVTFPTGGTLSYMWTQEHPLCATNFYDNARAVKSRTLDPNNGTAPSVWTYGYVPDTEQMTVVTDPASNDTVHTFSELQPNTCPNYETQTQFYQNSYTAGTLLKTVNNYYQPISPTLSYKNTNAQPWYTTTLWVATNQINKVVYSFDTAAIFYDPTLTTNGAFNSGAHTAASYGLLETKQEYDYGNGTPPGSPLRTTVTSYEALNNSSYLANNILGLPECVTVSGVGPGSTTMYGYDGSAAGPCPTQPGSAPPPPPPPPPPPSEPPSQPKSPPTSPTGPTKHSPGGPIANVALATSSNPLGGYPGNQTAISRFLNTNSSYLTTSTKFNLDGTVNYVTDANGNIAATYNYSYSPPTYTICVTNALGQKSCSQYDYNTGLLLSTTDANGQTTQYEYEDMLRPKSVSYPDGGLTTYVYDDAVGSLSDTETQLMSGSSSSEALTTIATFDGLGRVASKVLSSDPCGPDNTTYNYDNMGRTYQVSNPYRTSQLCPNVPNDSTNGTTTYQYDALSRVTSVTQPDNTAALPSTVQTYYAGSAAEVGDEGNCTNSSGACTGPKPVQRISQTDGLGRVTTVCEITSATLSGASPAPGSCGLAISGTGFLTTYQYDALNNVTGVSQGGLKPRSFTYDSLSRLISSTNPESGTITYGYDANGNLTSKVAPAPNQPPNSTATVTTAYAYDPGNRNTGINYSDGTPAIVSLYDGAGSWPSFSFGYSIGRLTSRGTFNYATNSWDTLTKYGYDKMGRVNATSQCGICTLDQQYMSYNYDYLGDVTGLTDAIGNALTYGYNAAAQLTTVTTTLSDKTHPGTLLSAAEYNSFGNRVSAALGNPDASATGILKNVHYDNRDRLTETETDSVTPPTWGQFEHIYYSYAPNGNVTSAYDGTSGDVNAYFYDDFNRLRLNVRYPWAAAGINYEYAYDRYGNRWNQTLDGSCTAGISACMTFDEYNHVTGGPLSYDAAGNVINDGNHAYTYDAANQLTQVDGGSTASYVYDGSGHRVVKTTNGVTVQYVYDLSGHVVTEESSSGQWNRGEVYAGGQHLVTYRNWVTYFIAADMLGSERMRSTLDRTSYESCMNLPFGDGLTCIGSAAGDVSPLHFTGKERDAEDTVSGNDNFGARFYGSSFGRFMSPDPSGLGYADRTNPQSLNLYPYVLNNPLKFTDLTGLECVWDNGTYDSENDPDTGSPGSCQNQGGTWIELGENGSWSASRNFVLQQAVANIQSGYWNAVAIASANGSTSYTFYDSQGRATITDTAGTLNAYGYSPFDPATTSASLVATLSDPNGQWGAAEWRRVVSSALDPNDLDQRIQYLSDEVAFMTTHPFAKDLHEGECSLATVGGYGLTAAGTSVEPEAGAAATLAYRLGVTATGIQLVRDISAVCQ
jgi:RHS repeat-associated protein